VATPAVHLTPQGAVDNFINTYEKFRADSKLRGSTGVSWWLSRSVKVLRATTVFSVECTWEDFSGQAHPFFETHYLNLDAATGGNVPLTSILKDGSMARLMAIAETHFRKERKLSPADDLAQQGFNFPNNRFQLNDNYGVRETALVFFFNPYEVASHAMGWTRIEIPYDEIRYLLRPGLGIALTAPATAGVPSAASGQIQIASLLDDLAGETDGPSLSPDGKTLAFDWCRPAPDNSCGIYTRPLAGGPAKLFVSGHNRDGFVSGPRWSPDGKTVAFTHFLNRWEIRLVARDLGDGAERELGNICEGELSWSPDSRFVAAARDAGYMVCHPALFPAAGGQPIRDLAESGGSPAFSPNGHLLAYAEGKSLKLLQLGWDYRPAGPATTIAQEPRQIVQVNWTREGKSIVYEASGDVAYLRCLALQPGARPQAIPGLTNQLSISEFLADGNALAIEIQPVEAWWRADLHAMPAKVETVSQPACLAGSCGSSPDGRQRVFVSTRTGISEIRLANADGTSESPLVKSIPGFANSDGLPRLAGWSPDGKWIAFTVSALTGHAGSERSDLYVVPVSGGPPRRLAEDITDPVWSRDSQCVYSAQLWKPGLVRVAVSDGSVTELGANGYSPKLSPDGQWLYFLSGRGDALLRIPVKGGVAEVLRDQPNLPVPRYTVGQKYLYLVEAQRGALSQPDRILRFDPQTRQASALAEIPFSPAFVQLSADERFLYFEQSGIPIRRVVLVHGM
jgi:Tol biopolymer transport system component